MILDLSQRSPGAIYHLMTQTLVPRPIAWVLTENDDGGHNLAPFSYFNAVSSNPPLIMISVGKKPDGSDKDTHRNIREREHYTVHIADSRLLDALNQSSATLEMNDSELKHCGLDTVDFDDHPVPRLFDARVAYACKLHDIHLVGNTPQAVIYGEVTAMYIDDAITTSDEQGRMKIHADRLDPVSRLGAAEYMSAGDILHRKRPI